ncbi:hypothetical protein B0H10DRAFT_2087785, partial [Mycena sp. CBHHK59/15]
DANFLDVSFAAAFLVNLLRPRFLPLVTEATRRDIVRLVGRLINVLGSDSVALDGRHTPALYSRFFSSLLAKHTVFPIRNDSPPTDDASSILSLGQTSQPPLHMYIPHRTVNGEKSGGNRYEDEQPGIPDVWDPVWYIGRGYV